MLWTNRWNDGVVSLKLSLSRAETALQDPKAAASADRRCSESKRFASKNDDGLKADFRLDTMQGATVRGMVATLHADLTQRGGVMMQTMTRGNESSAATGDLLVAFELSQRWWKVGFTTGMGHRVRTRRIAAGALEPLAQAIADAKKMLGLAAEVRVISCYEAGRDGFWLHGYLTGRGDTNYVVDAASIEVDRRARRTKTDAVDRRG
jgi:hypothetical protein